MTFSSELWGLVCFAGLCLAWLSSAWFVWLSLQNCFVRLDLSLNCPTSTCSCNVREYACEYIICTCVAHVQLFFFVPWSPSFCEQSKILEHPKHVHATSTGLATLLRAITNLSRAWMLPRLVLISHNLVGNITSDSSLCSQLISDFVWHSKWIYGSLRWNITCNAHMRHPTEITFVMFALALLAKPANPVVRWFFADGNKCSGLPPLRAKTALMKVGKLCIACFHNVKEFISLE